MSVSGKRGVGIPVILLHDAEGGLITIELKNGCVYRGLLEEASDNMNCTIKVVVLDILVFTFFILKCCILGCSEN